MSSTAPALRVHHLPAVRMEHLAADVGAVVAGEEEIAGRHFLRLARPRHVLAEILHVLRAERRWDERHPDRSRRHRVGADLTRGEGGAQRSGEGDDGAFAGGIVDEPRIAAIGRDRATAADATAAGHPFDEPGPLHAGASRWIAMP